MARSSLSGEYDVVVVVVMVDIVPCSCGSHVDKVSHSELSIQAAEIAWSRGRARLRTTPRLI